MKAKHVYRKPARRPVWLLIAAGVLAVLAALYRFVLVGYKTTAYLLLGAAVFCVLLFCLHGHKAARRVLVVLVAAGVVAAAAAEVPVVAASRGDEPADAPYLIVLGAGVNGSTPSQSLVDRLEAAREYLTAHPDAVAIVSGGQGAGEDISEAAAMREWLVVHGIDGSRILREEKSTSTQENLTYSFDIIRARGDDPADGVAIVSSEYHLYRAKKMAARLGATPYGVAGRTGVLSLRVNYFLREAFAVWYLWVFG